MAASWTASDPEEPGVPGGPEAGVDELDGDSTIVRLADELLADRAGDPLGSRAATC